MIEKIEMPDGAIGFRASGKVTADDYRTALEPGLREAAEGGEIRLLYVLEDGVEMDAGAMAQDAKVGLGLGIGHHSAWKRTAIVTDTEWIAKAVRMFTWMTPGEVKVYGLGELGAAREWVGG